MGFSKEKFFRFLRRPLEIVILRYLILAFIVIPLLMFFSWCLTPVSPMSILIIDKSAVDVDRIEHSALTWILKQQRLVNPHNQFYDDAQDYYGFHRLTSGGYRIRDLSSYSEEALDSLSSMTELVYAADAYGTYTHDLDIGLDTSNRLIYGGLNAADLQVLQSVNKRGWPIIGEFSILEPPTRRRIRDSLETLFQVNSTGWVGRYFISLDTTESQVVPPWVVNLYQKHHQGSWPFKDSGIVLVRGEEILILEYGTHLTQETPYLQTSAVNSQALGLPEQIHYPFWFDIVRSPSSTSQLISSFWIPVNARGDSLLKRHRLPKYFPAVVKSGSAAAPIYYFAGDFSDNPVPAKSAYFGGIQIFQSFFYNKNRLNDRRSFFWKYYRPLMVRILDQTRQAGD